MLILSQLPWFLSVSASSWHAGDPAIATEPSSTASFDDALPRGTCTIHEALVVQENAVVRPVRDDGGIGRVEDAGERFHRSYGQLKRFGSKLALARLAPSITMRHMISATSGANRMPLRNWPLAT